MWADTVYLLDYRSDCAQFSLDSYSPKIPQGRRIVERKAIKN